MDEHDEPIDDDNADEQSSSGSADVSADGDEEYVGPTHVFFENEALIRSLNDPRRGDNDPELAQRLFSAIMQATLIALVPEEQQLSEDGEGEVELEGDVELSFVLVRHPDVEGDIVPMFTDEGSLGAFLPDGGRYVALAVRDLFPLLLGADGPPNIVINPGGDEALLLTPRMVQDLIDAVRGYGTEIIDEDTDVVVAPAELPMSDQTQDQITELLVRHPAVLRATQLQWFMPDRHDEPSLVLAIELDPAVQEDARRFALASLWRELSPVLRDLDRQVEMVDVHGQRKVLAKSPTEVPPFYERTVPDAPPEFL